MPGKLRRRSSRGAGLAAETPDASTLPLVEAEAARAGLPRAFGLEQELIAAGYFELGVMAQWKLVQDRTAERAAEAADPLLPLRELADSDEPMVRFHVPGAMARVLVAQPEIVIEELLPLASDESMLVAESVQAFGLRPQADALGPEVLELLHDWINHPSEFVRRAAVEAVRPRGVWVKHLDWSVQAPAHLVPLLDHLRGDSSRYVANAVGNTLNDISRRNPELVLELAARWQMGEDAGPLQEHVIRKGLRSLLKSGDPRAMAALGYGALDLNMQVRLRNGSPVEPNTALVFEIEIHNEGPTTRAELVYQIETAGKNPQRPRRQRYRAGEIEIAGRCMSEFFIRERIFDRKSARLIDGGAGARFFLNGVEYGAVSFEVQRV